MFGTRHTFRNVSIAITVAASLTIVAAPSAGAAHRQSQSCAAAKAGWVTVIDDQGLSTLQPSQQAGCVDTLACAADGSATGSPFVGWVFVTDENGVPWLDPTAQNLDTYGDSCASGQAGHAQEAQLKPVVAAALQSPYPGWDIVADENGIPWLYPSTF